MMMRFVTFALPLLSQLAGTTAAYTLEEVQNQISSFHSNSSSSSSFTSASKCVPPPTLCPLACAFLSSVLPQEVSFPNTATYEFQESRYWSQQQEFTRPACRVAPKSAEDVSLIVLTARVTNCQFAVKGGGHAAFEGASNSAGGITIDMINMDQVTLSEDKTQVTLGPGITWYQVYTHLEQYNLTAIGGRVSAIGAGLVYGGGIAFSSVIHGWACDNVILFEVVLADGSIVEVSFSKFPDLFWALRGGGNNFGIITRFVVYTYPHANIWAGSLLYPGTPESTTALLDALYWFNENIEEDPNAQVILAFNYLSALDEVITIGEYQYNKPIASPEILRNLTSAPGGFNSTLRFAKVSDITQQLNESSPGGLRQSYWTATYHNSPDLMQKVLDFWLEEFRKVKDALGLQSSCVFQPITRSMLKESTKNGGNALGLEGEGELLLLNIAVNWNETADDDRILRAARNTINRSAALAQQRGLWHHFLYQNYASREQKVFPGYGEANLKRLQAISHKYDPQQVFQNLEPGYHKLFS